MKEEKKKISNLEEWQEKWEEERKDNLEDKIEDDKLKSWFDSDYNSNTYPIQTLVNMHQFGYTVKKEKLYTVEIPNPNGSSKVYLGKNEYGKVELFTWVIKEFADDWKKEKNVQLTENEIKEDFAYLWEANLPKEVKDN